MDIKLNVYKDKFCQTLDRTEAVSDLKLSTGVCEDIIALFNLDTMTGVQSLDKEGRSEYVLEVIKNAYPYLKGLLKELFNLTDEEMSKTDYEEQVVAIWNIVVYAFNTLGKTFKNIEGKN